MKRICYLCVLVNLVFVNILIGQEIEEMPLTWMTQAKAEMSESAWGKIPALIRPMLNAPPEYLEMQSKIFEIHQPTGADPLLGVLVKYQGNPADLESMDLQVGSQLGDIFTLRISINRLSDLAENPDIINIEPSVILHPHLDASIVENKANLVHEGNYTTTPPTYSGYTGKGVLVTAIDSGIDWEHGDFINDSDGTSRIKYIWDQTLTPLTDESNPPGFFYGVEYTQMDINDEIDGNPAEYVRTEDVDAHGTHVMGIIAGDGSSTGGGIPAYTYVGMAPQADILFVKTGFYTTQVIDGIHYAMQRADEIGKPLVINLSLGSQYGAHDGTSLFDQSINNAVNTGNVTIVVSAGNEGTDTAHGEYIHAEGTVTTGATDTTTFSIPSYSPNSGGGNDLFVIDMWYQGGDDVNVKVTTPNGYTWDANTGSDNNSTFVNSLDGAIYIDNAVSGIDPNNGDHECYIQIWDYYSTRTPESGTWTITVTGNMITESGHYDSWICLSQVGNEHVYYTSTSGSNKEIIGTPGTAEEAITVAAHSTKTSWVDYWGSTQTVPGAVLGDLAYFSSAGPTREDPGYITGRQKPDICTSGFGVISARSTNATWTNSSTYRNEDGIHLMMWGTSMSAPHVAGAVALMLEKDPTLNAQQAKTILTSSANSDSYTGSVPNYLWGYGKLDIHNAIQQIQQPQQAVNLFPSLQVYDEVAGETASYIIRVKNLGSLSDNYDLTVTGNAWPTSTWDASGTSQISNTGTIASNSQVEIMIKVQVPAGTLPSSRDDAIISATSASNPSVYDQATLITRTPADIPWSDNFPTAILDTAKWNLNVGPAEVNSIGISEPSFPYSLNLNGDEKGGDVVQSQSINLLGKENVMFSYYYERSGGGDSPEADDDLWVDYYSSSGSWVNLRHYLGSGSDMSSYALEQIFLPSEAYHKRFKIRFRNVGTAGPNDDWFIDDVLVETVPVPDIVVSEESMDVTLAVGDSTTRILNIFNMGDADLNFDIKTKLPNFNLQSAKNFELSQIDNTEYYSGNYIQMNENNLRKGSPNFNKTGGLGYTDLYKSDSNKLDDNGNIITPLNIKNLNRQKNVTLSMGDVIKSFPSPDDSPFGLTWANGYLWNVDTGGPFVADSYIYQLNPENGAVISSLGPIGSISGLTWDGSFFWGCDAGVDMIYKIDPMNGSILQSFPSPGSGPVGLAWDGQYLWNTDFNTDLIYHINPVTGTVISSIPSPDTRPAGTGYDGQYIWVNGRDSALTYKIDPISESVITSFQTPPSAGANNGSGITFDGQYLWLANTDVDMIYQIDIELVGIDWITFDVTSGTIPAASSQDITVKLNAANLIPDSTYHANIIITSNDPYKPTVTIPVQLMVTEGLTITGTVDSAGITLEGAVVQAWDNYPDGAIVVSDTSDASGTFSLSVSTEGTHDIRAYASGYFPVISENVQAPASGISLTLEALPSVTATNEWVNYYSSNSTFWKVPVQIGDVVVAKDLDSVVCGIFEINTVGNYGLMAVYRDDAATVNVDEGANPGDIINFEINENKAVTLGPDSPVWTSNGAILNVDLATNMPPTVAVSIQNIVMNEDDPDRIIADLDTIFFDPDNDSLIFSSQCSVPSVKDSIDNEHRAIISLAPNWYGEAVVIFTAYDGWHTVSDTAQLIVHSIDDPPNNFSLLSPANGSVIDTLNPTLIWQQSIDPDEGDIIKYNLNYGRDSSFVVFYTVSNLSDTSYSISEKLVPSTTYFWTVAAFDTSGAVTASLDTFKFVTSDTATFVDDTFLKDLPKYFDLSQNYPNPFNPSTKIKFALPKPETVKIEIYNIIGQNVQTLLSKPMPAGYHEVEFNGQNLSSGVYLYRIEAGDWQDVRKMVLIQ